LGGQEGGGQTPGANCQINQLIPPLGGAGKGGRVLGLKKDGELASPYTMVISTEKNNKTKGGKEEKI